MGPHFLLGVASLIVTFFILLLILHHYEACTGVLGFWEQDVTERRTSKQLRIAGQAPLAATRHPS
jgi:hypothetical protein